MIINPHTLSPDILECPRNCPFLGMRTFMPNTLPFYCNQFETFLGANSAQKTLRWYKCRGILNNLVETGLAFIDSYTVDHFKIEETKRAFLKLDLGFQKMFVKLVSQTGAQIVLDSEDSNNPNAFTDKILKTWEDMKNKAGSPEVQGFKDVLNGEGMPLMTRQTKTLLMNLFMVMDNSEKEMMKNILQNPKQVEAFLDSFQHQPQDQDLLKNVRALVYDYDRKRQQEMDRSRERMNRLEQERQQRLLLERAHRERQKVREHSR